MQRHDVASTFRRRCLDVICLLGINMYMYFLWKFLFYISILYVLVLELALNLQRSQAYIPGKSIFSSDRDPLPCLWISAAETR